MLLDGQIAVVTGSAVGIGRGIALALAEEGADVACIDIDSHNNNETVNMINELGRKGLSIDCDVADKAQVRNAMNQTISHFGQINILVNNAAIYIDTSLTLGNYMGQAEAYERSIAICALGSYYCALAASPEIVKAGGGNIINIITEHIKPDHLMTGMGATGYDSAKWVQWRQTESWAVELKESGVRVNALCPGATVSPMLEQHAAIVLDKAMQPADVALAAINILKHGPDGPTGQSYLIGPSGSQTGAADAAARAPDS